MIKILNLIFALSGKVAGLFWSQPLDFIFYTFKRSFVTGVYARRFKSFGRGTMLASPIRLINAQNIITGRNSSIMKRCVIETCIDTADQPLLSIGDNISLGEYSHITCANRIVIGGYSFDWAFCSYHR